MPEYLFLLIVLLSCLFFYLGTGRDRRVLLFYLIWIPLSGTMAISGWLQHTEALPPRMLFILLPVTIAVIALYRKLNPIKINFLLALHCLRIPVELALYHLFLEKQVPALMTFEGWNMDIWSGISAFGILVYSLFSGKTPGRLFLLTWNIAGLLLLTIIVSTAILSAPSPVQLLAFDQPNTALFRFPYTWLPAIVVPLVLLAHLLCLKSLRKA